MKKKRDLYIVLALCALSFTLLAPTGLYWFDAQVIAGDHAPEFTRDKAAQNLAKLIPHQERLNSLDESHFTAVVEQRETTARAIALAQQALELSEDPTAFNANMYLLSGEMSKLLDGHQITPLSASRYMYPLALGAIFFSLSLLGAWRNRSSLTTQTVAF
jgi:hypothetical protein